MEAMKPEGAETPIPSFFAFDGTNSLPSDVDLRLI